jgi:hypothetical protein
MNGFKQPGFVERQEAAAKARQAALEKFRAKAADPALAERLTARTASAAERRAIKNVRETEKVEKKARDAERARQAERDAALAAERAKTESAARKLKLETEQKAARDTRYAARKSRSKRK